MAEPVEIQFGPPIDEPAPGSVGDAGRLLDPGPLSTDGGVFGPIPVPEAILAPLPKPPVYSREIVGPMDSWVGKVKSVHDGAADAHTGLKNTIQVERVRMTWAVGGNHTPASETGSLPLSGPTPPVVTAYPWPLKHDQETHHTAAGEFVMILDGRDGRYWYVVDDDPFIAEVIAVDGVATTEAFNDGAGNNLLTVIRQGMTGGPGSLVLADLQDEAPANIEYTDVYAVPSDTLFHGWRIGDKVWVQRRGAYMFCWDHRESFLGKIVATGPDAEGDFTDERYWVEEQQVTAAWSTNSASYTYATRSGSPRTVPTVHLDEIVAGSHALAAGTYVIVTMQKDPDSDEPVYVFSGGGAPLPAGTTTGDMLYWNNTTKKWTILAAPTPGSTYVLISSGAAPSWAVTATFACPE